LRQVLIIWREGTREKKEIKERGKRRRIYDQISMMNEMMMAYNACCKQ